MGKIDLGDHTAHSEIKYPNTQWIIFISISKRIIDFILVQRSPLGKQNIKGSCKLIDDIRSGEDNPTICHNIRERKFCNYKCILFEIIQILLSGTVACRKNV